jgi:predicted membrane protein
MRTKEILHELKHHLPFTAFATISAIILVIFLQYLFQKQISENLFKIFHPLHVMASSIVTAGIFYKYKPKLIFALLVGVAGSIIIGSLSDIILPWLGGSLLGLGTSFHLLLIEKPVFILLSALIGSSIGISTKITKMPHFIHVFLSVFASLFYLLAFSQIFNTLYFIVSFFIVFLAVIIPCCMSDLLFPFFFLGKKIKKCECK